jgi:hypothetical protein
MLVDRDISGQAPCSTAQLPANSELTAGWPPRKTRLTSTAKGNPAGKPTHVLVVNLDYKAKGVVTLIGPGNMEVFDAAGRTWSPADGSRAALNLPPGGGQLVRLQSRD